MLSRAVITLSLALLSAATAAPLVNPQYPLLSGDFFGIPGANATYDYVIVGGGTAGLAMAGRLAEDPSISVAVIEAGGFYEIENGNTSQVPGLNGAYDDQAPASQWVNPLTDWGFLTVPQRGLNNMTFHYTRGKMLGGSSAANAFNYVVGTAGCYQAWADAVDDQSYALDAFLPYFTHGVNYSEPNTQLRASNASVPPVSPQAVNFTGGPIQISHPNWALPFSSWAQLAFREMGLPDVYDLISGELIGSQYDPLFVDPSDETRSSSETAYLGAAIRSGRTNLKVYTHTLAKKVLFDETNTAVGVQMRSGTAAPPYVLNAREEVIVSAGAFQSPQLLMVSGVGPQEQLQQFNISVVADRPGVGQNMWDHPFLTFVWHINTESFGALADASYAAEAQALYYVNRTGILTNGATDILGFEKLPEARRSALGPEALNDLARFPSDWPEIEYQVVGGPVGAAPVSTPDNVVNTGVLQPVLLAPLSRGTVTLGSADMTDPPLIDPNLLGDETDQKVAVEIFKRARTFFNTTALQPVLLGDELVPGPFVPLDTDEQILEYLRGHVGFNWHASCTCKMGRRDDPMAVVDSEARVVGVNGLRVVDASAFALLPPEHPTATVYALAEKIAAGILRARGT